MFKKSVSFSLTRSATRMIDVAAYLCCRRLSKHSAKYFSPFQLTMITETAPIILNLMNIICDCFEKNLTSPQIAISAKAGIRH